MSFKIRNIVIQSPNYTKSKQINWRPLFVWVGALIFGCSWIIWFALAPRTLGLSDSLRAEGRNLPPASSLASLWGSVRSDFAGLSSQKGIGHWLNTHSKAYPDIKRQAINEILQSENNLGGYLASGEVRRTMPAMGLEIQYRGTPVFSRQQGIDRQQIRSIASVSKTITAVAVLLLVQDKKIALNDDIAMYLPEAPWLRKIHGSTPITIRSLLSQSSGISYSPPYGGSIASLNRKISYPIAKQSWEAGQKFHYSNFNYYILAALIEKVSGMGYDQFLQKRIFDPLQMRHTRLAHTAKGAAGIHSSLADLSWFMHRVFAKPTQNETAILSPELQQQMIRRPDYFAKRPDMEYYGMGIRVRLQDNQIVAIWHSGLWRNVFAQILYFPQEKSTLVQLGAPSWYKSDMVGSFRWQSVAKARSYVRSVHHLFLLPDFKKASGLAFHPTK